MEAAVRLSPFTARFRAERGEAALRTEGPAAALAHYDEAVRLLPMNQNYRVRREELRRGQN